MRRRPEACSSWCCGSWLAHCQRSGSRDGQAASPGSARAARPGSRQVGHHAARRQSTAAAAPMQSVWPAASAARDVSRRRARLVQVDLPGLLVEALRLNPRGSANGDGRHRRRASSARGLFTIDSTAIVDLPWGAPMPLVIGPARPSEGVTDEPPFEGGRRHHALGGCGGGQVVRLYRHVGATGRWVSAGRLCRRCGRFWPSPGTLESSGREVDATARQIA